MKSNQLANSALFGYERKTAEFGFFELQWARPMQPSLFGKQEASSGARSFALSNCTGMLRLC
jgi:hypothetical protein